MHVLDIVPATVFADGAEGVTGVAVHMPCANKLLEMRRTRENYYLKPSGVPSFGICTVSHELGD